MSTKKSPLFQGASGHPVDVTSKQGITVRFTQRDAEVWHGIAAEGMFVTLAAVERPDGLPGILGVVCEISSPNEERWMADGFDEAAALTNAIANCAPLLVTLVTLAEPIPPAPALPPVLPVLEGHTLWIPADAIGVVLRVPDETPHSQIRSLREAWNRTFPPVPAVVLAGCVDVKVLRLTTDPSAMPEPHKGPIEHTRDSAWATVTEIMTGERFKALRTRLDTIGCKLDFGIQRTPPEHRPQGRSLVITITYSERIEVITGARAWWEHVDLSADMDEPPRSADVLRLLGAAERQRDVIARYA